MKWYRKNTSENCYLIYKNELQKFDIYIINPLQMFKN